MMVTLLVLAGCSGDKNTDQLENPSVAFAKLTAEHREAWQETILDLLPEMKSYAKSQTRFTVNGDAMINETDGKLTFDFIADGKSDTSDQNDPKMEAGLTLSGMLTGGVFAGSANAALDLKVVNSSVFLSLKSLEVDFPSVPTSEILAPIKPIIGKWYGDSFDTISEQTGQNMNVQDILMGRLQGPGEVREKIAEIIGSTELFTMNEYLGAEAGLQKFSVTVNNAAIISAGEQIIDILTTAETEKVRMKADLNESIATLTISGTLGLLQDEPKYFTFDGTVVDTASAENNADVVISFMEDTKSFAVEPATGDQSMKLTIMSSDDSHDFTVYEGKKSAEPVVVIKGNKSPSSLTLSLFDPETQAEKVTVALTESGGTWSGTITNADQPDTIIEINELTFDESSLKGTVIVKNKTETLATVNVSYEVSEATSVIVSPPETYDPFANLIGNFLPLMMMGAPGIGAPEGGVPTESTLPGQTPTASDDSETIENTIEDSAAVSTSAPVISPEDLPAGITEAEIKAMIEASGGSLPQ